MGKALPAWRWFWVWAGVALAADQAAKWAIYENLLSSRETVLIPGFFSLIPARNCGIVWGLFAKWPALVVGAGVIAAVVVVALFSRYAGSSRLEAAGWGMILGGAAGNLIDRGIYGYVRDFLDFRIAGWHWPTFNIADTCITIGAVFVILQYVLGAQSAVQVSKAPAGENQHKNGSKMK